MPMLKYLNKEEICCLWYLLPPQDYFTCSLKKKERNLLKIAILLVTKIWLIFQHIFVLIKTKVLRNSLLHLHFFIYYVIAWCFPGCFIDNQYSLQTKWHKQALLLPGLLASSYISITTMNHLIQSFSLITSYFRFQTWQSQENLSAKSLRTPLIGKASVDIKRQKDRWRQSSWNFQWGKQKQVTVAADLPSQSNCLTDTVLSEIQTTRKEKLSFFHTVHATVW